MSTLNKFELSTGGVSTVYKIGNVIEGYLNKANNKFYEDAQYTTEINAESDVVYLSLDTNKQYRYDTTKLVFVSISGGNDDHVYNTKAAMLADLANVSDGDIMYTKEDTNDSLAKRISALETGKQNKTDNALATTAKTIVGAINEINTDLSDIGKPVLLGSASGVQAGIANITLNNDSIMNYNRLLCLAKSSQSPYPISTAEVPVAFFKSNTSTNSRIITSNTQGGGEFFYNSDTVISTSRHNTINVDVWVYGVK